MISYSESAFYDGNHCSHVAAYEENQRLKRIRRAMEQARIRRVRGPADITDASRFPNIAAAIEHARKLREQWPDHWRKA